MQVCKMPSDNESKPISEKEVNPFANLEKSKQNEEIKVKTWIEKREGNKITTKTGEVMYICLECEEKGKGKYFSTEKDLKDHTQLYHGCNPDYVR